MPCRRLGSLTSLYLVEAVIYLPSLLCIGHQLQQLRLESLEGNAILRTGALPGARSDIFAAGWGSLRHLSLDGVCIDAAIGAVHLPSLEHLCMRDVKVGEPEGAEHIFVDTFAAGCPSCTVVDYKQPLPILPAAGLLCKDFRTVQQLTLLLEPLQMQHISDYDWPPLPTTVTKLRFGSMKDTWGNRDNRLDMYPLLELAAGWLSAGALVRELWIWDACTSGREPIDEHQQRLIAKQYEAVCARLHGLKRLRMFENYDTLWVLNAIVTALPDLKHLLLDIVDVKLCAKGPISCSGLDRLELRSELRCNWETLRLSLGDAGSLRTFLCIGPYGGKMVEVRITGHDPAASIVPSAEVFYDDEIECMSTRLTITLGEGRAGHRWRGAACVRFKSEDSGEGKDAVWVAQPLGQC